VLSPAVQTYPIRSTTAHLPWIDVCSFAAGQDDHLCLVAGMRRDQTSRLQLAGISTMAGSP